MTALLVISFVVGLFARTWRQSVVMAGVLIGLRLAWFIVVAAVVTREGSGYLAQMLGYIAGLSAIEGIEFVALVFLAAGVRRLISGSPRGPADRLDGPADGTV